MCPHVHITHMYNSHVTTCTHMYNLCHHMYNSHVSVLYLVVPPQSLAEADIKVPEVVRTRHFPCPVSPRLAVRVNEGRPWVLSQQCVEFLREPGQVIVGNFFLIQLEQFLCESTSG